jgi:hypothetical protein
MQQLVPFLADLIGVALAYLLLAPLSARLHDLDFINSIILGFAFLLFCLAVYALKKLAPAAEALARRPWARYTAQKRPLAVLGVFFAFALTLAIAYVVGFLDSVIGVNRFLMDEPAVALYLLLTPASWFGLSLIYMLLLSTEVVQTVQPGHARYALLSLLGLSGVNLMAVVFTAVGDALWLRFTPPAGIYFFAILNFLLYLLLFGPPRLIYEAKQRQPWGVLTFLPLLLYLAWLAAA